MERVGSNETVVHPLLFPSLDKAASNLTPAFVRQWFNFQPIAPLVVISYGYHTRTF